MERATVMLAEANNHFEKQAIEALNAPIPALNCPSACKHRLSKTYICHKTGKETTAIYCQIYLRLITLDNCHTCTRKEP